jgi:hypothetical protein
VSEQLGHANAAFTLDVYSHVMPHMQDEAAAKVEAVLLAEGSLVPTTENAKISDRIQTPGPEVRPNEQPEVNGSQYAALPEISREHRLPTQEHRPQPSI